ncbi:MAG: hypothetical protein AAGB22_16060, partial [Bacteroidota bacterium]
DGSLLINVTFADPPSTNLIVRATFDVRYEANSTLELVSATADLPIQHVLTANLEPGEAIKVQDPVQSLITMSTSDGFAIARQALNLNATPQCMTIGGLGTPRAIEFTPDGNHIFVGTTNGQVHRISGINQLYEASDIGVVTTQTLAFQTNAIITGIAIDHNNPNRVIVTTGNYGLDNHVFLSQNALSANPSFSTVQGDLPPMPVYEAEIDINDPSIVLLGTEFGVWATDNVNAGAVEWTDENNELMYAPTYDVIQQKLPFGEAVNHGVYYIGTHGRGIWKTGSLVSTGDELAGPGAELALDDLKVYPNPADEFGTLEFELAGDSRAEISLIDVQGKV